MREGFCSYPPGNDCNISPPPTQGMFEDDDFPNFPKVRYVIVLSRISLGHLFVWARDAQDLTDVKISLKLTACQLASENGGLGDDRFQFGARPIFRCYC